MTPVQVVQAAIADYQSQLEAFELASRDGRCLEARQAKALKLVLDALCRLEPKIRIAELQNGVAR